MTTPQGGEVGQEVRYAMSEMSLVGQEVRRAMQGMSLALLRNGPAFGAFRDAATRAGLAFQEAQVRWALARLKVQQQKAGPPPLEKGMVTWETRRRRHRR